MFEELIGNEKLKATAASDIYDRKPSHAYIIEGPAGSGRHTAARLIAKSLFCERISDVRFPCGECLPCRKVGDGISADVIFVNRGTKATIGIDTIRELKASIPLAPVEMAYKVYIIEEADKMTAQAQNSLLLSLEEPPSFVVYILLCTDSTLLLETVRSRAPVIKTELFPADVIAEHLSKDESLRSKAKNTSLEVVAAASGGSIGKAIKLLTEKDAPEFKEAKLCRDILPTLLKGTLSERISLLKIFPSKRDEAVSFFKTLDTALRDILIVKKTENGGTLFFTDRNEAAALSSMTTLKRILKLERSATDAAAKIASNVSIQPVIMLLLTEN